MKVSLLPILDGSMFQAIVNTENILTLEFDQDTWNRMDDFPMQELPGKLCIRIPTSEDSILTEKDNTGEKLLYMVARRLKEFHEEIAKTSKKNKAIMAYVNELDNDIPIALVF